MTNFLENIISKKKKKNPNLKQIIQASRACLGGEFNRAPLSLQTEPSNSSFPS